MLRKRESRNCLAQSQRIEPKTLMDDAGARPTCLYDGVNCILK